MDIPQDGLYRVSSTSLHVETSHIRIEFLKKVDVILDGHVKGNTLSGVFIQAGKKGTFHVHRIASCDLGTYEKYLGTYEFPNRIVVLGQRLGHLIYLEGRSLVDVFPLSDTVLFSEKGEVIQFMKNGKAIVLHPRTLTEMSGRRASLYTEEEVQFCNGGVTLSGIVSVPSSEGPYPAVVLIHGSGAETCEGYRFLADHLARHQIAALRYDKRGTGSSTGDWYSSTLEDLADDAVAGIHYLQTRKDIQPGKIGVLGTSQGGWIAPIASSSHDVAFMILISAAGVSPQRQELYRVSHEFMYSGNSSLKIKMHLLMYRSEIVIAKIVRTVNKVIPVEKILPKSVVFGLYLDWDFDPVPVLRNVTCPILSIFGELDKLVPVEESVKIMEEAFKDKDYTIKVFPGGNHALLLSEVGVWSEIPRLKKKVFVPGYYDLINNWIQSRVT